MTLSQKSVKEQTASLKTKNTILICLILLVITLTILATLFFPTKTLANTSNELLEKEETRKIKLLEMTPFYENRDTNSLKISILAPQEITVIKQDEGYYLIETWLGQYWIKPKKFINEKGVTKLLLEKNYTLHNYDTLNSNTNLIVSPQVVTLIDETDIWWKIETWVGEKYLYKNEGKKVAYLKFDDGPTKYTKDLLELLNEHNAKATFFMLQPNMHNQPKLVKQIANEGHFTAFHSVTHDKNKLYNGSPYNPVLEMEKARQTLKKITAQDHYLVRMPYGSHPFMTLDFRDALVEYNYKMWDWTIDSYDWKYIDSSYNNILLNLKQQLTSVEKSGKDVVILFHELPQTLKVLPSIISLLHEKGYQLKAYNPDDHIVVNFWGDTRL